MDGMKEGRAKGWENRVLGRGMSGRRAG